MHTVESQFEIGPQNVKSSLVPLVYKDQGAVRTKLMTHCADLCWVVLLEQTPRENVVQAYGLDDIAHGDRDDLVYIVSIWADDLMGPSYFSDEHPPRTREQMLADQDGYGGCRVYSNFWEAVASFNFEVARHTDDTGY